MNTRYRMVILNNKTRQKGILPVMIRDDRFTIEVMNWQKDCLQQLTDHPADLLVIDLCCQPEEGLCILRQLRLRGVKTEAIAYILQSDTRSLRAALRLGVVDCITHPFEIERFSRAVDRFLRRVQIAQSKLTQEVIDDMFSDTAGEVQLPKGLQNKTLNTIRAVFSESPGIQLSCEDVVEAVSLSRITVQRYLAYLSKNNEVRQDIYYETGGRPRNLYQCNYAVLA